MAACGRYVVMLGYAGARTALTLAELHSEEVQKRFPRYFIKQEKELRNVVNRLQEVKDVQNRQEHVVALEENEIFPALWILAQGLDAGLDVELQKIPVLQYIIEISELFDANPYVNMTALENRKCFEKLPGDTETGTIYGMLIATDEPEKVVAFGQANELPAAVIGRLTDGNDRVVRNGEIVRYLTPEG